MGNNLYELGTQAEQRGNRGVSIATGVVTNNLDSLTEGKVLVRIPTVGQEVWARLVAPGAGAERGIMFVPQIDDEVLVALGQDQASDAFVIGGLWNTSDRMPSSNPVDLLVKRIIKTGVAGGIGHEVEFDDALQSISITSSTEQKITIDPLKIELSNTAGTLKITLDNTTQGISIEAVNSLELKATQIKLQGANIDIEGAVATNVKSSGMCQINAPLVKIN